MGTQLSGLVIYVAKNTLINAIISVMLIALAMASCGILYFVGHHMIGLKTFDEGMGDNAWDAELKAKGVVPNDAHVTVREVKELAPGVFSLDVYVHEGNGWIVYKYIYYNKHTGAHVVVATNSRPSEPEEHYLNLTKVGPETSIQTPWEDVGIS